MNTVFKCIFERRSIRSFKSDQIDDYYLKAVLDAGILAPSARNQQPWHFTVIQNQKILDRIVEENKKVISACPELSEKLKSYIEPGYHNFFHAPTVVLVSGDPEKYWHVFDCGLAMQNMAIAAQSLAIGSCIIGSARYVFEAENPSPLLKELGVPEGYKHIAMLALGFTSEESLPPPRNKDCINYIK